MRSSKHRNGVVGELRAKAKFNELGMVTSTPESEARYDFIIDDRGSLHKIQCKSAFKDGEYLRAEFRSKGHNSDGSIREEKYNSSEIDAFCIYNRYDDEVYLLWFNEAPDTGAERTFDSWRNHLVDKKI